MIWKMRIPDDGWLMVSLGHEAGSRGSKEGDGVLFTVGVSDGRTFEELFTQHIDPFHNKSDRRWVPVLVDLSAYAGEEVELIFNTNASPPGKAGRRAQRYRALGSAGNRDPMTSATRAPVPLLDLEAQYRPLRDEILAAITRVCDSQRFIMGPEVEALERELAPSLGVRARHRGLVGHRRAARRADGARDRPGRRSHHEHVFIFRDGRLRRAARARPRCSSTSIRPHSTSIRRRSARR